MCSSPNPGPVLGFQVKFVTRHNVEGLIPGIDVTNGIAAILARRMDVGRELAAQGGFILKLAPALREGDEEALLAGKAADHNVAFAFEREKIRVVCDQQPCRVGDVLAEHLFTVDASVCQWAVPVELLDQA